MKTNMDVYCSTCLDGSPREATSNVAVLQVLCFHALIKYLVCFSAKFSSNYLVTRVSDNEIRRLLAVYICIQSFIGKIFALEKTGITL